MARDLKNAYQFVVIVAMLLFYFTLRSYVLVEMGRAEFWGPSWMLLVLAAFFGGFGISVLHYIRHLEHYYTIRTRL